MSDTDDCSITPWGAGYWCETHRCWPQYCEGVKDADRELDRQEGVEAIQAEEWPVIPS